MLTKHELETFKKQLEDAKRSIETTLGHLEKDLDYGDDVDGFEEETDEAEEHANQADVKKSLKERLEHVGRALAKIERGNYGVCENCGKEIETEVLHALPESALCKKCKKGK